jgi:hypothetical protein
MTSQETLNRFISDYNQAYVHLLTRASRCDYGGRLFSFISPKDLLDVIRRMHATGRYSNQVSSHPFPFRNNEKFLRT